LRPRDTQPPTLHVPDPIMVEAAGPSGTTISYTATAVDDVDGPVTPVCDPPSGSTFSLGNTTVSCRATDSSGNTATASFTITVQDTTPPTIIPPQDIVATATGTLTTVTLGTPIVSDVADSSPLVTNNATSTAFPIGTTAVDGT